jgi:hypothetical protein
MCLLQCWRWAFHGLDLAAEFGTFLGRRLTVSTIKRRWRCGTSVLAPHVDVRTDGGYIVVAPSRRREGRKRIQLAESARQ